MNLDNWAKRWNVPPEAIVDLRAVFGAYDDAKHATKDCASEASVINLVRLEASKKGANLFRNNVGATYTEDGAFIRYGLANDSKSVNTVLKSADLIGIRPVTVVPAMIGTVIGQFISREIKKPSWRYSGTDREKAQLKWAELITAKGGDACFATGEGTL